MQLLAPDILEAARDLPPTLSAAGLALGVVLWLWGGRSYRFWLVLLLAAGGGLVGLQRGPEFGVQPLVAGLLLALAGGALAVSLLRPLLFVAGGFTALAVAQATALGGNELLCFLVGGLAGVLLYRLWVVALTSLAGTLFAAYSALSLADRLGQLDSAAWAGRNALPLNGAVAAVALLGGLVQFYLGRRPRPKGKPRAEEKARPADPPPVPPPSRPPWAGAPGGQRRAG